MGPRLLVDLLLHEVLESGFLGLYRVPCDPYGGSWPAEPHQGLEAHLILGEDGHVPIIQEDHVSGMVEDGGDVTGH